jgi:hypothetical protein
MELPIMRRTNQILAITLALALTAGSAAASAQAALSCSVAVDYVQTAQDGTIVATESYQRDFLAEPGVEFVDDFSTPTRLKVFTASTLARPGRTIVTITYFNDVGTFNSVEFGSQLALLNSQIAESVAGAQTFSTSLSPLSGHYTTDYTLVCRR